MSNYYSIYPHLNWQIYIFALIVKILTITIINSRKMNLLPPPPHKNAKVDKNKSMRKNCNRQSEEGRPPFYSPAGSLMEIENKIDFGLVLEKIKKI